MEWSDDGIVLGARRHGEAAAIVTLLTRDHGRHVGLVHGGAGRRQRGVYQTGNLVAATWRARLAEHLGTFACETVRAYAAEVMAEKGPLLALCSAAALLDAALPEREPNGEMFGSAVALIEALLRPRWPASYVRWEAALLAGLGFGLDLATCAATGTTDKLIYVSPRTGRAVSAAAGARYRHRLLALPGFLRPGSGPGSGASDEDDGGDADGCEIADGLALTGYFLHRHVFAPDGNGLPPVRQRLIDVLAA